MMRKFFLLKILSGSEKITMLWIVDRIENDIAVIETESGNINIELKHLPEGTKEGSVIKLDLSAEDEQKRRKNICEKMNRLFAD